MPIDRVLAHTTVMGSIMNTNHELAAASQVEVKAFCTVSQEYNLDGLSKMSEIGGMAIAGNIAGNIRETIKEEPVKESSGSDSNKKFKRISDLRRGRKAIDQGVALAGPLARITEIPEPDFKQTLPDMPSIQEDLATNNLETSFEAHYQNNNNNNNAYEQLNTSLESKPIDTASKTSSDNRSSMPNSRNDLDSAENTANRREIPSLNSLLSVEYPSLLRFSMVTSDSNSKRESNPLLKSTVDKTLEKSSLFNDKSGDYTKGNPSQPSLLYARSRTLKSMKNSGVKDDNCIKIVEGGQGISTNASLMSEKPSIAYTRRRARRAIEAGAEVYSIEDLSKKLIMNSETDELINEN